MHKTQEFRLLIRDLVQAAYESGYYSGKGEDGSIHHKKAIMKRKQLGDQLAYEIDKLILLMQ